MREINLLANVFIPVAERKVYSIIDTGFTISPELDSKGRAVLYKEGQDEYCTVCPYGKVLWHRYSTDTLNKILDRVNAVDCELSDIILEDLTELSEKVPGLIK